MDAHQSPPDPTRGPGPDRGPDREPPSGGPADATGIGHRAAESDPELRPLDRRIVTVWRLAAAARAIFFSAAAYGAELAIAPPLPAGTMPLTALVLGIAYVIFWPPAQYRQWGFRVRERDLFVRRGVLFKLTSVIPHGRIQHVDTQRGPVERALGLARVVVFTAGIRGADVSVPGLALEDAERLRDRLAALGGGDDAV